MKFAPLIFLLSTRSRDERYNSATLQKMAEATKALVAPAEVLADGQTVYNLYRGVICVCRDSLARIWVDLSHMQVCVAKLDSSVIARFDVRDLVTRSVKMEEQKSPEVSPEDVL